MKLGAIHFHLDGNHEFHRIRSHIAVVSDKDC